LRPKDQQRADELNALLASFDGEVQQLPGVELPDNREAFIEQMLESIRRVQYPRIRKGRDISPTRLDPGNVEMFDTLVAAMYWQAQGDLDEAFWLVFLFVYFGRSPRRGWQLAREFYGRRGAGRWTWAEVSADTDAFESWVADNAVNLGGSFGNHRKYESKKHIGQAVRSYVDWVDPPRTHSEMVSAAMEEARATDSPLFRVMFDSMDSVFRFGRTARFDYLAMLGKLELAPIAPDRLYLHGSTGPRAGARLLFGAAATRGLSERQLDELLMRLSVHLQVGPQEMEDALCNWQKSPAAFRPFRG